jgi:D-3-phosphoglycerate dehydrogenase
MVTRHSVIVTDGRYFSESMQNILKEVRAKLTLNPCRSEDEVISRASTAEVIITTSAIFSKQVLESLHQCIFIIRCGIGIDNIDIKTATEKRILVGYLPDWYIEDVSNHIMALILDSSRKVTFADRLVRNGNYSFNKIQPVKQLKNRILGLLGFGKISKCLLYKLQPFNFEILVYDPYMSILPVEIEKVDLPSLLHRADFIVINCPLTEETRGMIGEMEFSLMKPEVYIINTARGAIINEVALIKALHEKRIAGAALDVISQEPVRSEHPLLQFDNVIITPHIAWYSEESLEEVRVKAAEDVVRVLKGNLPSHPLNPEVWTLSCKLSF